MVTRVALPYPTHSLFNADDDDHGCDDCDDSGGYEDSDDHENVEDD